jgi:hypothetical protein
VNSDFPNALYYVAIVTSYTYCNGLLHITLLLFTSLAWEPDTVIISLTLINTINLDVPNSTQEIAKNYRSADCSVNDKVSVH